MIENLPNEIWKEISGYENIYSVSNKGRVKAHYREFVWNESRWAITKKIQEHILVQSIGREYYKVSLSKNGKSVNRTIHRLVTIAFVPNPENKPQVNHKDGNKLNNDVSNLEWNTPSENCLHSYRVCGQVSAMKGRFGKDHPCFGKGVPFHPIRKVKCDTLDMEFPSISQAARILGLSHGNITTICQGKRAQTHGLSFRYL